MKNTQSIVNGLIEIFNTDSKDSDRATMYDQLIERVILGEFSTDPLPRKEVISIQPGDVIQWEYEIRTEYGSPDSDSENERQLNVLGGMGWELAAIDGKKWYFKRRMEVYREQTKSKEFKVTERGNQDQWHREFEIKCSADMVSSFDVAICDDIPRCGDSHPDHISLVAYDICNRGITRMSNATFITVVVTYREQDLKMVAGIETDIEQAKKTFRPHPEDREQVKE